MILFAKQKQRHRHKRISVWTPEGKKGKYWETETDVFTLLSIKQITN